MKEITASDIDHLESWWIEKSRGNFLAYRKFMRPDFIHGWFINDLCRILQKFYLDLETGKRPILFIQAPPQHGKSWTISDFMAWLSGKMPNIRIIYASYSDTLGIRCNKQLQRFFESDKNKKIFPEHRISSSNVVKASRNSRHIEYIDNEGNPTGGQFRNTTTGGPVTGESLDLGIIDDAVKGREQANSITWSEKIWQWLTDDFLTRFSESAGLLIIMTRWSTHDIIGRLIEKFNTSGKEYKLVNYQAIATKDEDFRKKGHPLFPELKSLEFLLDKKAIMPDTSWESLYQGNPTISGGNLFKDSWWKWWKDGALPAIDYKIITADTAQKAKQENDWTVFQCWGVNRGGIFLLDKLRAKMEAPTLRREAEMFYKKHNTPRIQVGDPILRGMYIEDKSSGTGLIQELRAVGVKVFEVPRNKDKVFRAQDAAPFIESGFINLNTSIAGVDNLTKEAREFPNGEFDDDIDTLLTAVEVTLINKDSGNLLLAAMEAD